MTKQAVYIRAVKALPNYFIDEDTRLATVDDHMMAVANPKFKPMWYDDKQKKKKWRLISDELSPFFYENGELKLKGEK